jgi:hypothetical protein
LIFTFLSDKIHPNLNNYSKRKKMRELLRQAVCRTMECGWISTPSSLAITAVQDGIDHANREHPDSLVPPEEVCYVTELKPEGSVQRERE